jgi:hypothetical protein
MLHNERIDRGWPTYREERKCFRLSWLPSLPLPPGDDPIAVTVIIIIIIIIIITNSC